MFQFATFWLVLFASAVLYWQVPQRARLAFLALVSIGCVGAAARIDAVGILAWVVLIYFVAPLAADRSAAPAPDGAPARQEHAPDRRPGPRIVAWLLIGALVTYTVAWKYFLPYVLHAVQWPADAGVTASPSTSASSLFLPLGISYLSVFTFKFIHYIIETARGNVRGRSLWALLCYAFLFPIFIMGPIERFDHFLSEREERWSSASMIEGLTRILVGVIKWCVLGELLFGEIYRRARGGELLARLGPMSPMKVWWIAIELYLYGYMNFAGYSDIAIGASRLFGLRIMENFNSPLLATNPASFWRRWHMTLAGWCQTYVFMPVLGYTRRPNVATYASFIVIGLWHGVSWPWFAWGLYHGTGVVAFGQWTRLRRQRKWLWANGRGWIPVGIAATILFVAAGEMLTFAGAHSLTEVRHIVAKLMFLKVR